jgi:hypothetical protein
MRNSQIIIAALFAGGFFIPGDFACAIGPDPVKLTEQIVKSQDAPPPEVARPVVEFIAEGKRDPFIVYTQEDSEVAKKIETVEVVSLPADFVLQGIIWGAKFNQAVIKNKVVKIGDTLNEVSILDIVKDGVTLFYKGRTYTLSSPAALKIESLKKPVK